MSSQQTFFALSSWSSAYFGAFFYSLEVLDLFPLEGPDYHVLRNVELFPEENIAKKIRPEFSLLPAILNVL